MCGCVFGGGCLAAGLTRTAAFAVFSRAACLPFCHLFHADTLAISAGCIAAVLAALLARATRFCCFAMLVRDGIAAGASLSLRGGWRRRLLIQACGLRILRPQCHRQAQKQNQFFPIHSSPRMCLPSCQCFPGITPGQLRQALSRSKCAGRPCGQEHSGNNCRQDWEERRGRWPITQESLLGSGQAEWREASRRWHREQKPLLHAAPAPGNTPLAGSTERKPASLDSKACEPRTPARYPGRSHRGGISFRGAVARMPGGAKAPVAALRTTKRT